MAATDLIAVDLTELERRVLVGGILEWGGPARCTEEFAVAMGFQSVDDLFDTSDWLHKALKEGHPLKLVDWVRVLLMTEIVFASDVIGSGRDWQYTVRLSDEETIAALRSVQRKVQTRGVVGVSSAPGQSVGPGSPWVCTSYAWCGLDRRGI